MLKEISMKVTMYEEPKEPFFFFFNLFQQLHTQEHYVLPVVIRGLRDDMMMRYIEMNI